MHVIRCSTAEAVTGMTWRDLRPWPDDWVEPERPYFTETSGSAGAGGGEVTATFADGQSRQWYGEWVRSKRGWTAFLTWVDERR
jgi:hypothetical protein